MGVVTDYGCGAWSRDGTRTVEDEDNFWAEARTLARYGELTAQWLEGRLAAQPGYIGPCDVDEHLAPGLTETLIVLNRAGLVTTASQAGSGSHGPIGGRWAQAAAVTGIATMATAQWFWWVLVGTRFRAVISPVRHASDTPFFGVPVTWRGGEGRTWFGPVSDLMVIPSDAEVVLTVYDPVPGRNDLWPVLLRAAWARTERHADA